MRFILGITGGIGSGKSAATQWFESQGIRVIDADVVAREIVEPGQTTLQKIQQLFGDWVLLEDGHLDRRALREHIFQFPEARHSLEQITHPAIRQSIIQQLQLFPKNENFQVNPAVTADRKPLRDSGFTPAL